MLSQSFKRFAIGYILLVGVPLLVLVGNLQLGKTLRAQVAIGGVWDINFAGSFADGDCYRQLPLQNLTLSIVQSGKHLVISRTANLAESVDGTIDGEMLTFVSLPIISDKPYKDKCFDTKISIFARIDSTGPTAMVGELFLNGPSGFVPLKFNASRRPTIEAERQ